MERRLLGRLRSSLLLPNGPSDVYLFQIKSLPENQSSFKVLWLEEGVRSPRLPNSTICSIYVARSKSHPLSRPQAHHLPVMVCT